jgi:hypothetical protein
LSSSSAPCTSKSDEAIKEGKDQLPQPVAWEGCMSKEVCCVAHDHITDHHKGQLQGRIQKKSKHSIVMMNINSIIEIMKIFCIKQNNT